MNVSVPINVVPIVDLSVVKSVDRDEHVIDDLVVWTITVSNAANGTNATNVVLNDTFPAAGFNFVNYTATAGTVYNHATGIWTIGNMANGTSVTLVINTIAKQNGTFTNHANVTCNEDEWNYTNNYDNATVVVVDFPIVKTVNNATPYYNANVTYNLTVTNVGKYNYTQNITIVDTLPEGVYFIGVAGYYDLTVLDGPIQNGNTVTWVVTGIAPNTTGIISIDVWVHALNTLYNNETMILPNGTNKTVDVPIDVQPIVDVSVVKTVDNPVHFVDDTVVWTITVSNAANGTNATDVVLKDTFPAGFTISSYKATAGTYNVKTGVWNIGKMANGTSVTLTITSIAKVEGTFINHADVTCNETEWNYTNNYDNATVVVYDIPDINKTVNNTTPYIKEYVLYNITITNVGDVIYDKTLTVVDSLPEGLEYISTVSITGARVVKGAAVKGQVVTWKITDIDPNVPAVITVKARPNVVGKLVNNATVIGPDGTNKTVNCTINVKPLCDVEIIKLVNLKKVYVGEDVIWTIKVTNKGPSTAKNVVVTDQLPKGLKLLGAKVTKGSFNMKSLEWTVGSLASGASATLKLTTKVLRDGIITNPVSVNTTTKESNYTNNKAKNTTRGIPVVDLELKKSADKEVYKKGEEMHWTITVINHGPSTATGVVVTDVLPSGVKFIRFVASKGSYDASTGKWDIGELAKGESATIEIYCNVTAESGVITNYASVTCNEHDSNPDNNKDNASITVVKDSNPPAPPKMHPTGNPIVMVLLSLLAIVGVSIRRKL